MSHRLAPSTSSHASAAGTAHRVEVLRTLRAFAAHLLLGLQLCLRLVDGLPAVAAVARPVTAVPVVAVHRAIFAGIDVVLPRGDTGVGVGVVSETAATCRALAAIDVADVSCATSGNDSGVRVVGRSAAIAGRVAGVDVGIGTASGNCGPASLGVVIGTAGCSPIIAGVRIGPGSSGARIRRIAPDSVHIGDGGPAPSAPSVIRIPAASVVAHRSPPRVIPGIVAIAVAEAEAPPGILVYR